MIDTDIRQAIAACVVAATIVGNVRSSDIAARYGGDELAVILPYADIADASVVAEKLRSAVEELWLTHEWKSGGRKLGHREYRRSNRGFPRCCDNESARILAHGCLPFILQGKEAGPKSICNGGRNRTAYSGNDP